MSKKIAEPEKIVCGIGTGRCGTESLASLLNKQKFSKVTHKRNSWRLGWEHCESHVDTMLVREVKKLERDLVLYGDVAFAWLPYIPYIWRQTTRQLNEGKLIERENAVPHTNFQIRQQSL